MIKKRKKPRFHRQYSQTRIAIKNNPRWRKPRGIYSWQALGKKSRGHVPTVGYRQPKEVRGKHPSGYEEVLVKNEKQLESIDAKKQAIRLSAALGMKKKLRIAKKAEEKKIIILNKPFKKTKKQEKKKKEEKTAKQASKSSLAQVAEETKPTKEEKITAKEAEEAEKGLKKIAGETAPTPEEKKAAAEVKKAAAQKKAPAKK
ncbi:MAG: eL32 family ribosomal protein [archaeon]